MKKRVRNIILLVLGVLLLSGFGMFFIDFHENLPLEENIDTERYMGIWYSVYEFPAWFQQGCECTTAEYSLNDDGTVDVLNTCVRYDRVDKTEGIAFPVNGTDARFKIQFDDFPFSMGDYNIVVVDDDYDTAMVATMDRRYLWILSREPEISDDKLVEYVEYAEQLGFRIQKLEKVNHEDC